ncbi:MAG: chromosomal replication initiator protein DnaA [Alphaproteobacteria bacterium]|nr:chromosomal replication initiator protein DnaA [Alphaproteobacteria bacterium]
MDRVSSSLSYSAVRSGDMEQLQIAWTAIRAGLRADIGARTFDHWLKPVELVGYCETDHAVRLSLPSDFMASWVSSHYTDRLTLAWRAMLPQVRSVRIETSSGKPVERFTAAAPVEEPVVAEQQSPMSSQFDRRLSFANFVTGQPNLVAFNAAKALASGERGSFSPLYIHSQTGLGKTHLLHAIGHEVLRENPNARILYMSAERFMFDFVTAMRARDTFSFKARLRSADVLMIDDVQFIAGKESTQEEFLHTVDELMTGGRRLVISADRAPHALDGVEGRILSRLTQGLVADIGPADLGLRRSILETKVNALGMPVPAEVIDLLAARIVSNIRELEGGLNRLVAYGQLHNRKIDEAFAEEVLAEMFRASRRRITIDEIQRRVSEHYRIRQAEMVSARRAREVARPRQVAMYLAKQLTPRSLPEIGRKFGGRDHTTVIHAIRQIERLRGIDTDIDSDVRTLIRDLEG